MIDSIIDRIIKSATPVDTDLVYVNYRDQLTDEQVKAMIADPFNWELDDHYLDWEHYARWESAIFAAEDMVNAYDPRDGEEQATIEENWEDIVDGIRDWLMDNDTSNPFAELARQTPDATVMIPLIDEDGGEWGNERKASQLLSVLGTTDESYYNKARELIANAPTDMGMAYIVAKISVADLVGGVNPEATITVNNPTVVYGNPFTGGLHSEDFTGHRFTAPIESILPDGSWGYPVEEVWGRFPGDEEPAQCTGDVPTAPAQVQEHLDTLYDYTLKISR